MKVGRAGGVPRGPARCRASVGFPDRASPCAGDGSVTCGSDATERSSFVPRLGRASRNGGADRCPSERCPDTARCSTAGRSPGRAGDLPPSPTAGSAREGPCRVRTRPDTARGTSSCRTTDSGHDPPSSRGDANAGRSASHAAHPGSAADTTVHRTWDSRSGQRPGGPRGTWRGDGPHPARSRLRSTGDMEPHPLHREQHARRGSLRQGRVRCQVLAEEQLVRLQDRPLHAALDEALLGAQ